jgi:hypothetical protein
MTRRGLVGSGGPRAGHFAFSATRVARGAASFLTTTFCILETENEHFYDWRLFRYHWPLSGLALEGQVLRKVYFENAEKILSRRNDRR